MCLIFAGSTDLMSAEHTSRFLVPFLRWLDPQISPATIMKVQLISRKAAHVTEYAILAALIWRAIRHHWGVVRATFWKPAVATLAVAVVNAIADEFHQSFVATRTSSPRDVLIDILGAVLGLMICCMFTRNQQTPATGAI